MSGSDLHYCPNCGQSLPPGSSFCPGCGAALREFSPETDGDQGGFHRSSERIGYRGDGGPRRRQQSRLVEDTSLGPQGEDEQRQRGEAAKKATGKVESALAELATAQTTADVQVAANRSADDGLALEEELTMDSRAQGAAAALSAIAGWKALNADHS